MVMLCCRDVLVFCLTKYIKNIKVKYFFFTNVTVASIASNFHSVPVLVAHECHLNIVTCLHLITPNVFAVYFSLGLETMSTEILLTKLTVF